MGGARTSIPDWCCQREAGPTRSRTCPSSALPDVRGKRGQNSLDMDSQSLADEEVGRKTNAPSEVCLRTSACLFSPTVGVRLSRRERARPVGKLTCASANEAVTPVTWPLAESAAKLGRGFLAWTKLPRPRRVFFQRSHLVAGVDPLVLSRPWGLNPGRWRAISAYSRWLVPVPILLLLECGWTGRRSLPLRESFGLPPGWRVVLTPWHSCWQYGDLCV